MSTEELQKRTTVNIQEKANLIWADFKFTKVAIKLPNKGKDIENVPFKEDIEAFSRHL